MRLAFPTVVCGVVLVVGCSGGRVAGLNQTTAGQTGSSSAKLAGKVFGGQQPIAGARVYLLAANTANTFVPEGPSVQVSNPQNSLPVLDYVKVGNVGDAIGPYVTTDATGNFSVTGDYSCTPGSQVYLYTQGGNPGAGENSAAALMAVLGTCPGNGDFLGSIPFISVNEVSTVAAAYAMADFAIDPTHVYISGTTPSQSGVVTAFGNAVKLADLGTGAALTFPAPQAEINTLANILAACVNSVNSASAPCSVLFNNAQSAGSSGVYPTNTAMAAINIAHNPTANITALFSLASSSPPFQPALPSQPVDFTIPLVATPSPQPYFKSSQNSATVFIGDSITAYWPLPVHNEGRAGEFTSDMIARFSTDVLGHGYTRVVILAGTNDIFLASSPDIPAAVQNVETMAQNARAAGMEVILCTLPANLTNPNFFAPLYAQFNQPITSFATSNNYPLVDFYNLTLGHSEYYLPGDGIHPSLAGYAVMEKALTAVVPQ